MMDWCCGDTYEEILSIYEDTMAAVLMYEGTCTTCGKIFRHSGSSWAYRRYQRGASIHYFCSWNCMRAFDAERQRRREEKHENAIRKAARNGEAGTFSEQ